MPFGAGRDQTARRVSVEAQSMQKPIVASNLGGSKETIMNKKTGLLYDSKKASEFMRRIIHANKKY